MGRHGENIRKRSDGRWEARYIQGYDGNGKAQYRYIYGKTYLDVKTKKQSALANRCNRTYHSTAAENTTLGILAKDWLISREGTIKESTYSIYINIVEKHIIPDIGQTYVRNLTTDFLERYLINKQQNGRLDGAGGLSRKTVADIRSALNLILRYSQTHGFPEMAAVKIPSAGYRQPQIQTLTRQEQARLEQVLFSEPKPLYLGILVSLYAGLRIGEVCALQWNDFQLLNGTLHVSKTLLRIQDHSPNAHAKTKILIDVPKTQCSIRTIPLPEFLCDLLEKNRKSPDAYLLTGTTSYMEPRVCLNRYKRLLKQAGVGDYTYHALRHTFATRCVEQGMDVKSLSEIMGHSNVSITMQRYVHPSLEMKRAQINKLASISIYNQGCGL